MGVSINVILLNIKGGIIIINDTNLELNIILNSRKGGKTTRQIIQQLYDGPKNANDIAKILNLNYKTIVYHLDIAEKYDYVKLQKVNGITFYTLTDKIYKNHIEHNINTE